MEDRVFRGRWVKTRPVWNQYAYHVTNITLQSGWWVVPTTESANWLSHNNYRQNVQGGALFPVPDLHVELTATTVCPGEVRLVARVTNEGSAGAQAGVPVRFYRTDAGATNPPELIDTVETQDTLLPGAWERVSTVYVQPVDGERTFLAVVDEGGTIEECDDDDNDAQATAADCPGVE